MEDGEEAGRGVGVHPPGPRVLGAESQGSAGLGAAGGEGWDLWLLRGQKGAVILMVFSSGTTVHRALQGTEMTKCCM